MGYKYNYLIQFDLDHLTQYEDVSNLEEKKMELDHLYTQVDEYEAKATILDRVKEFATEPPFILANNEHEEYEFYAYDQILKLIDHHEGGESEC